MPQQHLCMYKGSVCLSICHIYYYLGSYPFSLYFHPLTSLTPEEYNKMTTDVVNSRLHNLEINMGPLTFVIL